MDRRGLVRAALAGVLAGAAATFAKGKAEGLLQPLGEKVFAPSGGERSELGADPSGHPENMPPSELVDRVQHIVTGSELTDEQRQRASVPVHWATGVGFGVLYAAASTALPGVRAGWGVPAGVGLFATTHGSGLPLAGLQHPPTRLPTAWWVWEGGSHVVYGVVLELVLRCVDRVDRVDSANRVDRVDGASRAARLTRSIRS